MAFPIPRRLLEIDVVRSVAHGLTASSIGKPIGWDYTGKPVVWQDHALPQLCDPVAILRGVINADTLLVSTAGDIVDVPNSILPAGMPVDGSVANSRWLYWDHSADAYKHTMPTDSQLATESLYWIGASALAGYSVCIAGHPNRPAGPPLEAGVGFTTNTPTLFQIWGNKTQSAITPTNASPLVLDPIGWNLQPSSANLAQMGLSTNVGKDRLTNISGSSAYYILRWNCDLSASALTGTANLAFRFRQYNSSDVLQTNIGTINSNLNGTYSRLQDYAGRQVIMLLAANDYIKGDLTVTPSVGASFSSMGYNAEMTVSKLYTDRAS